MKLNILEGFDSGIKIFFPDVLYMYIKFFTLEEGEKSMLRRIKSDHYQLIQRKKLKGYNADFNTVYSWFVLAWDVQTGFQ